MPDTYRLQIVTQRGVQFDGPVEALRAPGAEGYFGVRPGHAPMIAQLREGRITVRQNRLESKTYECTGGVAEVTREGVIVLADDLR